MPDPPLPDPAALIAAMETAGFVAVGHRTGVYLRLRWPTGRQDRTLPVYVDTTAPEYATMAAGLLAELEDAERNGQAASAVLDLLAPTRTQPADDLRDVNGLTGR